ncbi:hypothetical protein AAZV13_17G124500 [Glycine max]
MASGTTRMLVKEMLQLSSSTLHFSSSALRGLSPPLPFSIQLRRSRGRPAIRCASSSSDSDASNKVSSRLSQVQHLLQQAEHRALSADQGPPPKITLDHVTVSFARSGGPGGQNVNKVNTKVDMRFNVKNAYWLSDRIRDKILQTEKNRINKDGELVISSTKTRTQKFVSPLLYYLFSLPLYVARLVGLILPSFFLFLSGVTLRMLWQSFRKSLMRHLMFRRLPQKSKRRKLRRWLP